MDTTKPCGKQKFIFSQLRVYVLFSPSASIQGGISRYLWRPRCRLSSKYIKPMYNP